MAETAIEWAEMVWNPIVGCSRVSAGCMRCYAERQAYRAAAMGISRYDGLTKKVGGEIRWTGEIRLVKPALDLPLRWKKPRRIFVNSMSDLFHESVPVEWIDRIFAVMALATQHTFQILTKRPERMLAYLSSGQFRDVRVMDAASNLLHERRDVDIRSMSWDLPRWPLPNVWLGVSVEDQATADARIPLLLQTPAVVRWVSYEPALGPVDFTAIRYTDDLAECRWDVLGREHWVENSESPSAYENDVPGLDWLVVGGESGLGARPFDLAWARQTIAQGRAAGIPVFVKQLGARPIDTDAIKAVPNPHGPIIGTPTDAQCEVLHDMLNAGTVRLRDRKGGDPAEWPEDLRVRDYP